MSDYLFPPSISSLSIAGSEVRFPVRRVYCVGRNYADHAKEMGVTTLPKQPMFFSKPASAVVDASLPCQVAYPPATQELHHEVEYVIALHRDAPEGRPLTKDEAAGLVFGYGVGLDLTRRDLQAQAKAKGHPWDVAKGFDQSAPVSALHPLASLLPADTAIGLHVNGELRQSAVLADMLFDVPTLLVELSHLFHLRAGDVVFTGTPSGVGAVQVGDTLEATLGDKAFMQVTMV